MSRHHGLQFKKFDLHVHTFHSCCYENKSVSSEDIVDEAISKGLAGIAITDHNTGEGIDAIKKAAKGKNLIVFPGVEITASGGESGIHIIAILDVDKGTTEITALLGKLSIDPAKYGKKDAISPKSVYDAIDVITSTPFNGIAILAHCTSTKGVLNEIKGETRKGIFSHPLLLAVESSENDFTNSEKIANRKRAVDILDGTDENYCNKKLGIIISSDSHKKEKIGSNFTYFKVDDTVTLESIRQCFIDRDVRIRQSFEYTETKYPYVSKIKITGGFFDGEEAEFHPGLNSILGAKGSGKSLLIELFRFGLGQPPTQMEIQRDHESKLASKLNTYGIVEISCVDETGTEFTLKRTFDYGNNHPFEENGDSIVHTFPVLFLSQNEIIKIAENNDEQLNFIDKFFDFRHYKSKILNVENELRELDKKFAESLRNFHEKLQLEKQIEGYKKELDILNKKLSDAIYDKYKKLEKKDNALKQQALSLGELKKIANQFIEELQYWSSPEIEIGVENDPAIKRNFDSLNRSFQEVDKKLKEAVLFIENESHNLSVEYKKWEPVFQKEKVAYEKHVRDVGGDKFALEAQRKKISVMLETSNKRLMQINEKASRLKTLKDQRETKIAELAKVYSEYSAARQEKCKKFEKDSNGRLKIALHELSNCDEFKNRLINLKKGSYLRDNEIDAIAYKISPNDFILSVLRYDTQKKPDVLKDISERTGLEIEKLKNLAEFLLNEFSYENLLEIQYIAYPQDRPEINYLVSENEYELLDNLSVGQKCTAMLIMALSEGDFPVFVDQPEDSLDVRSIWDDMCQKLRKGKDQRQFIFTTHNSSIAVASDTDKFTILESDAHKGKVVYSGALENPEIHKEVINYLEGGRPTYFTKYRKYNFEKRDIKE